MIMIVDIVDIVWRGFVHFSRSSFGIFGSLPVGIPLRGNANAIADELDDWIHFEQREARLKKDTRRSKEDKCATRTEEAGRGLFEGLTTWRTNLDGTHQAVPMITQQTASPREPCPILDS